MDENLMNRYCSREQLEKFIGKVCIWHLSIMDHPTSGKLVEVTPDYFLIEARDGRLFCARHDTIMAFSMTRNQVI